MFFSDENNKKEIGAFLSKADVAHIEDEIRKPRLDLVRQIVRYIYKSPEGWDERCEFNIKNIGDLVRLEEADLLKFRNFGRKSLTELHNILDDKELFFGMDVDKYLKSDEG